MFFGFRGGRGGMLMGMGMWGWRIEGVGCGNENGGRWI